MRESCASSAGDEAGRWKMAKMARKAVDWQIVERKADAVDSKIAGTPPRPSSEVAH